jgi:hypothetical protein
MVSEVGGGIGIGVHGDQARSWNSCAPQVNVSWTRWFSWLSGNIVML